MARVRHKGKKPRPRGLALARICYRLGWRPDWTKETP